MTVFEREGFLVAGLGGGDELEGVDDIGDGDGEDEPEHELGDGSGLRTRPGNGSPRCHPIRD